MRLVVASALVAAITASLPASAGAAQRWAAPSAVRASGACLAVDPCTLAAALGGASANDEVLLTAGRYEQPAPLVASVRMTLRGADQARPVIVGTRTSEDDAVLTFRAGGTLRHVELQATRGRQPALEFQGGVAEDVFLTSDGGNGARVYGAPNGTLLRDAVVRTAATNDSERSALRLRDSGSGDVQLRNVTALAPGANAIRCEVSNGTATIVNTIARGGLKDVKVSPSAHCATQSSNVRRAFTTNLAPGTGDQQDEPLLDADARPLAGSPTIDAGAVDGLVGVSDPAGCARGGAPDIGAFEYCPPPSSPPPSSEPVDETPSAGVAEPPPSTVTSVPVEAPTAASALDTVAELPPGVAPPAQGTSIVVAPVQGTIRFREPGTNTFIELEAGAQIPVGSEIDASKGRVMLVTAVAGGLQDGTFWGGRFAVAQRRGGDGMTSLVLKGGSFRGCPNRPLPRASAAGAAKKKEKPKRKLWSKDKNGRFRTHGHNSVATARGTNWLTEDTCAGTRTRVLEGAVEVQDKRRKRPVVVKASHSYLARR